MTKKWVYAFHEGRAEQKSLLGGKGANLAEMTRLGLGVPKGFTITTEACNAFLEGGGRFPEGLWEQTLSALKELEDKKRFGDQSDPLLVSVRSGAQISMPGMMDTVLNLGLNQVTTAALARLTSNPRFAQDSQRRLLQLFGKVVLGIPGELFQEALESCLQQAHADDEAQLEAEQLKALAQEFRRIIKEESGSEFPEDPTEQLRLAIQAVFQSWNGKRARDYRRINHIPDSLGTAVNVQTMVFGNMGTKSGTGVAFSRNPSSGEPGLFGEYLLNAQGEDVVAGVRTPSPILRLADEMPAAHAQLKSCARMLERHFHDMQDMEFTIERGQLYMLQTRVGKRTGTAALRIAVDMVEEGLINQETAIRRVDAGTLEQLLHPMIDVEAATDLLTSGLPASPGAATGSIVFDPDEAEKLFREGKKVLLVRTETAPEDFHGMVAAEGILTARGGMTSHAAVVARGMGKPCVCGAGELKVDEHAGTLSVGARTFKKGDWMSIDGSTGRVYAGQVPTLHPKLSGPFKTLMSWADSFRKTGVRANADTPEAARQAREFGAEGIGLCRTEHMFFEGDRILAMREMIVAATPQEREAALKRLEPLQEEDFYGIFKAMDGCPVTIRTLDPPLHEFLPKEPEEIALMARHLGLDQGALKARIARMQEANPMMGFRGCRLGLIHPEITAMQVRAIIKAALKARGAGMDVHPEIMIPLVGDVRELRAQRDLVDATAREILKEAGTSLHYLVGTMIELPRAALLANEIARVAEFFSFGTNDLTQMTFGLSRDDAGTFLPDYLERRMLSSDPFQVLDRDGVGQLVRTGVERGRSTRPNLKVGICGEHGGEPTSIRFFVSVGLNYVSCSPFRIPVARLAAAQADLDLRRSHASGQEGCASA